MSDQQLMNNYLLVLKSNVEVYVHGTLESSNQNVRDILKECLNATLEYQADTYDEMVEYGWYTVSLTDSNNIKKTYDKLCNN